MSSISCRPTPRFVALVPLSPLFQALPDCYSTIVSQSTLPATRPPPTATLAHPRIPIVEALADHPLDHPPVAQLPLRPLIAFLTLPWPFAALVLALSAFLRSSQRELLQLTCLFSYRIRCSMSLSSFARSLPQFWHSLPCCLNSLGLWH